MNFSNYQWSITSAHRDPSTGGVKNASWKLTVDVVDGDMQWTEENTGQCTFEPDPDAEGFVAFNDITEQMMLGWVWERFPKADRETTIRATALAKKLSVEQETESGLPWE